MFHKKANSSNYNKNTGTAKNNKKKRVAVTHSTNSDEKGISPNSNEIEAPSISTIEADVSANNRMKSFAKRWVTFLSGIFTAIITAVILILLGYNPITASIPLLNLSHQYPRPVIVIAGALILSFIGALILSSKQEHSSKSWRISPLIGVNEFVVGKQGEKEYPQR